MGILLLLGVFFIAIYAVSLDDIYYLQPVSREMLRVLIFSIVFLVLCANVYTQKRRLWPYLSIVPIAIFASILCFFLGVVDIYTLPFWVSYELLYLALLGSILAWHLPKGVDRILIKNFGQLTKPGVGAWVNSLLAHGLLCVFIFTAFFLPDGEEHIVEVWDMTEAFVIYVSPLVLIKPLVLCVFLSFLVFRLEGIGVKIHALRVGLFSVGFISASTILGASFDSLSYTPWSASFRSELYFAAMFVIGWLMVYPGWTYSSFQTRQYFLQSKQRQAAIAG